MFVCLLLLLNINNIYLILSFGTFCAYLNFSNVFEIYCSQSQNPSYLTNTSESVTNMTVVLDEGTWYWKVAAFNGNYTSFSEIYTFTICHPGTIISPELFPSSGFIEISSVNISWNMSC